MTDFQDVREALALYRRLYPGVLRGMIEPARLTVWGDPNQVAVDWRQIGDVLAAYDAALQRAETAERERDAAILREEHLRNMLDTEREKVAKLREDVQRAERERNAARQKWVKLRLWRIHNYLPPSFAASDPVIDKMGALDAEERPAPKPEPPRIGWVAEGRYYVCQRCGRSRHASELAIVHTAECQRQSGEDQR